jgi:hypothetical protein
MKPCGPGQVDGPNRIIAEIRTNSDLITPLVRKATYYICSLSRMSTKLELKAWEILLVNKTLFHSIL